MDKSTKVISKRHRVLQTPTTAGGDGERYTCVCVHHYSDALLGGTDCGQLYSISLTDFSCHLLARVTGASISCCDFVYRTAQHNNNNNTGISHVVFGVDDGRVFCLQQQQQQNQQRDLYSSFVEHDRLNEAHSSRVLSICCSQPGHHVDEHVTVASDDASGRVLVCSLSCTQAFVWSVQHGQGSLTLLHRMQSSAKTACAERIVFLAPTTKLGLLAALDNGEVLCWDVRASDINSTIKPLLTACALPDCVCGAACMTSSGHVIVCHSRCGLLRLTCDSTGKCDVTTLVLSPSVNFLDVRQLTSVDGEAGLLAAVLADGSVVLLHAPATADDRIAVSVRGRHKPAVELVSACGRHLVALLTDGTACVHQLNIAALPAPAVLAAPLPLHSPRTLSQLSLIDALLSNRRRLVMMLRYEGAWPDRQRATAWRRLLRLPDDVATFQSVAIRSPHPDVRRALCRFPVSDGPARRSLSVTLSALCTWNKQLSSVTCAWLPAFVFPFCRTSRSVGGGGVLCCELLMSVLTNWCGDWLLMPPYAPLRTLAIVENTLAHQDARVLAHLVNSRVTSRLYAWPLLQSAFSAVVESSQDWLILWDHVLVNRGDLLLALPVAFCMICRRRILQLQQRQELIALFQGQDEKTSIDVRQWLDCAYRVVETTPSRLLRDVMRWGRNDRLQTVSWTRPGQFNMWTSCVKNTSQPPSLVDEIKNTLKSDAQ